MGMREPWYRRFGDLIAPAYAGGDASAGGGGTAAEVTFIQREVIEPEMRRGGSGSSPTWRILDVGCGTGRHARALAALGHHVTGVDCSRGLLDVACALAARAGQGTVRWVEADARALPFEAAFDLALSLYGGAFGLGQDEGDDEAVVAGIARALVPGGLLLLTATSAAALVARFVERAVMTGTDDADPPFDEAWFVTHSARVAGPDGALLDLPAWWRAYTPRELSLLCRLCGLHVVSVYGCGQGDWQRRPPRLADSDVLVLARRPEGRGDG
jgi:SAM-dependent methyltransferase